VFQRLFLEAAGIEGTYLPFEVPPEALHFWIGAMPAVQGLNVTIPHKITVMAYCQSVSESAQRIGAVNTLCVTPKGLVGHNTDIDGFLSPLHARDLTGHTALIIGTGGACRAVAVGLAQRGVSRLLFITRNPEQGRDNLASLLPYLETQAQCDFMTAPTPLDLASVDLVVNTSPLGMSPNVHQTPLGPECLQQLPAYALVYDLVYNPLTTQLLKDAQARGLETQDGLDMLIAQGAASFALWTCLDVEPQTRQATRLALEAALHLRA